MADVQTESASPFAQSLLFGYVGQFLYEGDAPLAERRAQALALDTGLLAELLGRSELRELLDGDAMAEIEAELQRLPPERHPRDVDSVADLLRFVGDLTAAEAAGEACRRRGSTSWSPPRRALEVRIAGEERYVAIEDAGRCATPWARRCPSASPRCSPSPWPTRWATWSAASPAPTARSSPPRSPPGSGWASPSSPPRCSG